MKPDTLKDKFIPVVTILLALIVVWYVGAIFMNAPFQRDMDQRGNVTSTVMEFVEKTLSQPKPILPAPHQVATNVFENTFLRKLSSNRSLVYHAGVTLSSTVLGFALGTLLGIAIAVGIVHIKTLDRSLMPWIIASQTGADPGDRADGHRGARRHQHHRPDPEGADFDLSLLLSRRGRNGEGPALAGDHASRLDAHL